MTILRKYRVWFALVFGVGCFFGGSDIAAAGAMVMTGLFSVADAIEEHASYEDESDSEPKV